MKAKAKDYARAYVDLCLENPKKAKEYTDRMVAVMTKNADRAKFKKTLLEVERILSAKGLYGEVLVESSRKLSEISRKKIVKLAGKNQILEEKILPELIAGIRITVNDEKQFDGSLAGKIKKILKN